MSRKRGSAHHHREGVRFSEQGRGRAETDAAAAKVARRVHNIFSPISLELLNFLIILHRFQVQDTTSYHNTYHFLAIRWNYRVIAILTGHGSCAHH